MIESHHKTLGGALLVAGTAIGAGMLALPITTGVGGFEWAVVLFLACFLYMLANLFVLLEANLYTKTPDASIITMAHEHLGLIGRGVAWFSFLMLLYAAVSAYISASGSLVNECLAHVLGHTVHPAWGDGSFLCVFMVILYLGVTWVDLSNRFFMLGLFVSYILLVAFVTPHVNVHHLTSGNPHYLWAAVPVVVLSFTSHIILPSLRQYLNNNVKQLKRVLLLGSLLPLLFYVVWELLVVGVFPLKGDPSLLSIATSNDAVANLAEAFSKHLNITAIGGVMGGFAFFSLVTSFLGATLSLFDFLADGFHVDKSKPKGRVILLALSFLPPLIFGYLYPDGFVLALSYGGVFIAVLFGILPALMVWKARYIEKQTCEFRMFGGRPLLIVMMLLSVVIIALQIGETLHYLPMP